MKCMCHFNVIYFLQKTHNQTHFKECKKYFQTILYHMSMACVHLPAQSTIFLLKVKDYAVNLKFNQGPFGQWILKVSSTVYKVSETLKQQNGLLHFNKG